MSEIVEYNLLQWNCNSIKSKIDFINKITEIYEPFCLALQETKVNQNTLDHIKKKNPFVNYKLHNQRSIEQTLQVQTYGVGFLQQQIENCAFSFDNNSIILDDKFKTNDIQALVTIVTFKKTNAKFILANCYCRPNVKVIPVEELNQLIELLKGTNLPFLILGDFNARNCIWEKGIDQVKSEAYRNKPNYTRGRQLHEIINQQNLIILNDPNSPTRYPSQNNGGGFPAVLDLSLCSTDFFPYFDNWFVLDRTTTTSDHVPIIITLKFQLPEISEISSSSSSQNIIISEPSLPTFVNEEQRLFLGWKTKAHSNIMARNKFTKLTSTIDENSIKTYDDWILFLTSCMDKSFVKKFYYEHVRKNTNRQKHNNNRNRWWNLSGGAGHLLKDKLKQAKRLKRKYYRQRRQNNPNAIHTNKAFKTLEKTNNQLINNLKNKVKKHKLSTISLTKGKTSNIKMAWNVINDMKATSTTSKSRHITYKILDEQKKAIINDQQEIANMFMNFFSNKYVRTDDDSSSSIIDFDPQLYAKHKKVNKNHLEFLDKPFTIDEFNEIIKQINKDAAPSSIDKISNDIFTLLSIEAKKVLVNIFNKIYAGDHPIPSSWKIAIIKPIPKPNKDKLKLSSYRPIASTPSTGKVFEKFLTNRINVISSSSETNNNNKRTLPNWMLKKESNFFSQHQYGFRLNVGSEDMLFRINDEISHARQNKQDTILISFDLEAAYNNTAHKLILSSINDYYGIHQSTNFYQFINNFLKDQKLNVKINSSTYSKDTCTLGNFGVPQGSVLSPLLFKMALDGLFYLFNENEDALKKHLNTNYIKDVSLIGFADDIYIIAKVIRLEQQQIQEEQHFIEEGLQKCINFVVDWLVNKHKFILSHDKINYLRICGMKMDLVKQPDLHLNISTSSSTSIIRVTELKILGVIFDEKANFKKHLDDIMEKANKGINMLMVLKGVDNFISADTLIEIYKRLIRSKMEHGSIIYGEKASKTTLNKLEVVQNKAIRTSLHAFRTTPINSLLHESGLESLTNRRIAKKARNIINITMFPNIKWHKHINYSKDVLNENSTKRPTSFFVPMSSTSYIPEHDRKRKSRTIENMIQDYLPFYFPKIYDTMKDKKDSLVNEITHKNLPTTTVVEEKHIINAINTEFQQEIAKHNIQPNMLNKYFQRFLIENYHHEKKQQQQEEDVDDNEKNVLYIYTDGSKFTDVENDNSGLGIYIEKKSLVNFTNQPDVNNTQNTFSYKVNDLHSIFSIEALAILKSLQIVKKRIETNIIDLSSTSKIVIITDSKSVLDAIDNFPTAGVTSTNPYHNNIHIINIVKTYNELMSTTKNQLQLYFCWGKAHCDIFGNEEADECAKKAAADTTTNTQTLSSTLSKMDITHYIRKKIEALQVEQNKEMSQNKLKQQPLFNAKGDKLKRLPLPDYIHGKNSDIVSCVRLNSIRKVEKKKFKQKPSTSSSTTIVIEEEDEEDEEIEEIIEEQEENEIICQHCNKSYISFTHHYLRDCTHPEVVKQRTSFNIDLTTPFETQNHQKVFGLIYFLKKLNLIDDI